MVWKFLCGNGHTAVNLTVRTAHCPVGGCEARSPAPNAERGLQTGSPPLFLNLLNRSSPVHVGVREKRTESISFPTRTPQGLARCLALSVPRNVSWEGREKGERRRTEGLGPKISPCGEHLGCSALCGKKRNNGKRHEVTIIFDLNYGFLQEILCAF